MSLTVYMDWTSRVVALEDGGVLADVQDLVEAAEGRVCRVYTSLYANGNRSVVAGCDGLGYVKRMV